MLKWLKIGIGFVVVMVGVCALWVYLSMVNFDGFIPQDCAGMRMVVYGTVQNEAGNPIANAEIVVREETYGENPADPVAYISSTSGEFTAPIEMFVCNDIFFDVSAEGFASATTRHSFYDEWNENNFPPPPVPLHVTITLESID
jgi:hypothetical protein